MRKGFDVPVGVTLTIILAILAVAITLIWATNAYGGIVNGQCWQKTKQSLSDFKSDIESDELDIKGSLTRNIYMGDCIGGIVIFNKGFSDSSIDQNFAGFISALEKQYCPNANDPNNNIFKSYILMIPWKTLNAEADVGTWQQLKNKFAEYTKLQMFQTPACLGVNLRLDTSNLGSTNFYLPKDVWKSFDNLNKKNDQFCYAITKPTVTSGGGQYRLTEQGLGACTDEKK
jgi:hypothetical protein